MNIITSDILIRAYCEGFFPMAESKEGEIYWHSPDPRAIIPLNNVHIPKSMRKLFQKQIFNFSVNYDFPYVISECSKREDTWISQEIIDVYTELHRIGYAHSVETWVDGKIVGGLYGVAVGGAFFGESMFNHISNSSKAAYYFLIANLLKNKFLLLDSQYINSFTEQLGAIEIPRDAYLKILEQAIHMKCSFVSKS